jgi:hypothetical protein
MSAHHELEERVKAVQAGCERLRKENVRLLAMPGVQDPEHVERWFPSLYPANRT